MLNYDLTNVHEWPLAGKAIIIGMACAVVFYLAYFFDFTNLNKQLAVAQAQEKDLQVQLEMLYKKQAELKQYMSYHAELEKKLNDWQNKLVKQPNLPELLNEILKAGSASGIQFVLFNPGKETIEPDYIKTPIKIITTGTYHQIANFVSRVANMLPIVIVNDLTITKPMPSTTNNPSPPPSNALTAEMTLDVYYLNGNPKNDVKK